MEVVKVIKEGDEGHRKRGHWEVQGRIDCDLPSDTSDICRFNLK